MYLKFGTIVTSEEIPQQCIAEVINDQNTTQWVTRLGLDCDHTRAQKFVANHTMLCYHEMDNWPKRVVLDELLRLVCMSISQQGVFIMSESFGYDDVAGLPFAIARIDTEV